MEVAKTGHLVFGLNAAPADEAERELIESAQRGDRQAFGELVRRYDRSVLKIALRILRSPEDARDAYQEAFLKAYRKIDTFRFQCRFHTWLYRIATNVCLDQLRRRKARPEFVPLEGDGAFSRTVLDSSPDRDPGIAPDRLVRNREVSDRIGLALEKLSDRERVVFTLRHNEGMRLRAIGEACSMSEESAKQCLFRATRKLRKELGDVRA